MAALTFTQMKARVALNCDNLQTTDPVYTNSSSLGDYINEAANRVILLAAIDPTTRKRRGNFSMFPELRDRRWVDVTVNDQGYLLMPTNCLVPDTLTCTRLTTSYDQSRTVEYPLSEIDIDSFKFLDKSTSTVGWPTTWCRSATELLLHPTPTTAYLTKIVLRGIRAEQDLSGASDEFTMHYLWHPAVVDMATHLTMTALGWHDQAERWFASCERKIGETVSFLGSANRLNGFCLEIAGAPR